MKLKVIIECTSTNDNCRGNHVDWQLNWKKKVKYFSYKKNQLKPWGGQQTSPIRTWAFTLNKHFVVIMTVKGWIHAHLFMSACPVWVGPHLMHTVDILLTGLTNVKVLLRI